ncbi:MAG: SEL1-like repeat protein [bacterium]
MKIYDDILNHVAEVIDLSFDEYSEEQAKEYAVCHIGCLMTWLIKKDFTKFSNDKTSKVLNNEMFGSQFVIEFCDGKLKEEDLKEEIINFMNSFYPNYFMLYSKAVASELKNLPLEFILTSDDYSKIEFIFDNAFSEFSGGPQTNEIDKALEFFNNGKYADALPLLEKLAEKNNQTALSKLGFMYVHGQGVVKDAKKAVVFYRNAVGYVNEIDNKGINGTDITIYLEFINLINSKVLSTAPAGPTEAQLCERAADLGSIDAMILRGDALSKQETTSTRGLGIEWYQLGARQNNTYCQNKVGECYYNAIGIKQNYKRAFKWFNKASENNNKDSFLNLGKCYHYGHGVEKDLDKAIELYEKAIELNISKAIFNKALILKEKDVNSEEAFKLIEKSANDGVVEAQAEYANYLYNGIIVEKNEEKAIEYYKNAASKGDIESNYMLGYFYENGIGIKEDKVKASASYSTASTANHIKAKIRLAHFYENGIGVRANPSTAKSLLTAASKLGSEEATLKLQVMILNSKLSRPNEITQALEFLMKDIETNNIAQFELGVCYLEGIGVEVDLDEAIRLLTLAAKSGIEEAKAKVKEAKLKKLS